MIVSHYREVVKSQTDTFKMSYFCRALLEGGPVPPLSYGIGPPEG